MLVRIKRKRFTLSGGDEGDRPYAPNRSLRRGFLRPDAQWFTAGWVVPRPLETWRRITLPLI
jgi:hypothetical protein